MAFWMHGRGTSSDALNALVHHESPAQRRYAEESPRFALLPDRESEGWTEARLGNMPMEQSTGMAAAGCFMGCQVGMFLGLGMLVTGLCALGCGAAGHIASGQSERRRVRNEEAEEEAVQDAAARARGLAAHVIQNRSVEQEYRPPAGAENSGSKTAEGDSKELNQCMICLEEFAAGDKLRQLPCLHRYHCHCIDTWLQRSAQCPICKRDITDDTPAPAPQPPARPPQTAARSAWEMLERRQSAARDAWDSWREPAQRGSSRQFAIEHPVPQQLVQRRESAARATRESFERSEKREKSAMQAWIAQNRKQMRKATKRWEKAMEGRHPQRT